MTRATVTLLVLITVCLPVTAAHADGGVVRASETVGPWRVTVFTSPVPLRAGPADISVFVQNAATHEPVLTALVDVAVSNELGQRVTRHATREDATNRLMYAALLTLPEPGEWSVDVTVTDGGVSESLSLTVAVGSARPPWTDHLPWFALPFVCLALFAGHQVLALRHRSILRR